MDSSTLLLMLLTLAQPERISVDAEGAIDTYSEQREIRQQLERSHVSKRVEGLDIPMEVFVFNGTPATRPPGRIASSFIPQNVVDARRRRLRSVVRLTDALGELQCTGTLVRRGGLPPAILTAAHCLFNTQHRSATRQTVLASPRSELWVNDKRLVLDARLVTVPEGFRTCANQRLTFRECVMIRRQPDIAFITAPPSLLSDPAAPEPWNLTNADMLNATVVALGYGLDRTELPDEVLRGTLQPTDDAPGCARWATDAGSGQMVDFGDSGGPLILPNDDVSLITNMPTVIGVISGHLAPGTFTLAEAPEQVTRFRARLQLPVLDCLHP